MQCYNRLLQGNVGGSISPGRSPWLMVAEEGCLVGFLRAPKHGNSLLVNSLDIDDLKLVAGVRLDIQPSASRICEPSGDAQ